MTREGHQLGELTRGLRGELRLVGELRDALARQRAGFENDDALVLVATACEVEDIAQALEDARRRRVHLVGAITGDERFPLGQFEERMDGTLPEEFVRARAALREAGLGAAADVKVSRAMLGRALGAAGRRHGRPLPAFSDPAGPSTS